MNCKCCGWTFVEDEPCPRCSPEKFGWWMEEIGDRSAEDDRIARVGDRICEALERAGLEF